MSQQQIKILDQKRIFKYSLDRKIVNSEKIKFQMKMKIGDCKVENLQLIDKYYLDKKLIKNFQQNFGAFNENQIKNVEFEYEFPRI